MSDGHPRAGTLDAALGVVIWLLLAVMCGVGGAWAAAVVPPLRGRTIACAAAGLAVIAVVFAARRPLAALWERHRAALSLAGLLVYVAVLAAATWSELFNLGWFDRLPF